jgi:hypothetical protein
MDEDTAKKQQLRGRPFMPGVSGNPRGRPKGALNKRTLVIKHLLRDPEELFGMHQSIAYQLGVYFDEKSPQDMSPADVRMLMELFIPLIQLMNAASVLRRAEIEAAGRNK